MAAVFFELDAVVVAPHAVFIVEIKSYRGRIEGTDHDWYIPYLVPSPLKVNRLTAQAFKSQLKRDSYQAGQLWVEGLVFLSASTDVGVRGPASKERIHTKKTILAALQDPALVERLSGRRCRFLRREPPKRIYCASCRAFTADQNLFDVCASTKSSRRLITATRSPSCSVVTACRRGTSPGRGASPPSA